MSTQRLSISKTIVNILFFVAPLLWFALITISYYKRCDNWEYSTLGFLTTICSMSIVYLIALASLYDYLYNNVDSKHKSSILYIIAFVFGISAFSSFIFLIDNYMDITIPALKALCFFSSAVAMCRVIQTIILKSNKKHLYWALAVILTIANTAFGILSNAMWTEIRYNLPQFNLDYSYFIWNELHYNTGLIALIRYPALAIITLAVFILGFAQYKIKTNSKCASDSESEIR